MDWTTFFRTPQQYVQTYIQSVQQLQYPLKRFQADLAMLQDQLEGDVQRIDASLVGRLKGDFVQFDKQIQGLYTRLQRAEKDKQALVVQQIEQAVVYAFAQKGLRERSMGFLEWSLTGGTMADLYAVLQQSDYRSLPIVGLKQI